jgi:hypothetical protein
MIPIVKVTKLDGQTGVVAPSSKGICAIISTSSAGTANSPVSVTKAGLAATTFGVGPLVEAAAHILAVSGNPVVLVKGTGTTAGSAGVVALVGTGNAAPSIATAPYDDYSVRVDIVTGGVLGVAGITYTYSLDGGLSKSAVLALGTSLTIAIPASGVTVTVGAGAATVVAGDYITCLTTAPQLTAGDISAALEALRLSVLGWEFVLVGAHVATDTTVQTMDTWLAAREAEGRYRGFLLNSKFRAATGETEAQFLTALTSAYGASASIRGCIGADGGALASAVPGRGWTQKRPTSWALAARMMKVQYGTDPAYVSDGPLGGFGLSDTSGNPLNHDENFYPGMDALRLVSLRTFDRRNGTFITNANTIASAGSDYVWAQHIRVMNRACELAFDALLGQLSAGVRTNPKLGPLGETYIAEPDARRIEAIVNDALTELTSQVTAVRFVLSRTDNMGSNGPVTLNGEVQLNALRYVKEFDVNAAFVRSISVTQ